jgi:hypothetical protein
VILPGPRQSRARPSSGRLALRDLGGVTRWRRLLVTALFLCAGSLAACSDDTCFDVETQIGDACVPAAATAGSQTNIQVREACGTNCAQGQSCTAVFSNGTVVLTMHENHCYVGNLACDGSECSQVVVSCTLPALAEGDYPLILNGGPAEILRVRPSGTGACYLAQPPPAP